MSIEKYTKFISEQIKSEKTAGFRSRNIQEASKPFHKMNDDEKDHHINHLLDKAYKQQHHEIKARYGKKAADEANYGHGESVRADHSKIGTKVYGKNKEYLSTHVDHHTGDIHHDWH